MPWAGRRCNLGWGFTQKGVYVRVLVFPWEWEWEWGTHARVLYVIASRSTPVEPALAKAPTWPHVDAVWFGVKEGAQVGVDVHAGQDRAVQPYVLLNLPGAFCEGCIRGWVKHVHTVIVCCASPRTRPRACRRLAAFRAH